MLVDYPTRDRLRQLRLSAMVASSLIAATALVEGVPVLTLKSKHFRFIPGLAC